MLKEEEIEKKVIDLINTTKRKFVQSIELIVNLKIDVKKPENRINELFPIPHKTKKNKIVIFSDTIKNIEKENVKIINSEQIQKITKREAKKLGKNTDVFLADAKLMPLVGKHFGITLGPRGKMPKVIDRDIEKLLEEAERYVRIRIKDNPQIQCFVGLENDNPKDIVENILSILNHLLTKFDVSKIKSILIKKTMSKPIVLFKRGK
ncbi:MAG: 50S ribosomal protein L1 [Candidatus Aenigmarchaeota archaeon]|nr:50S ribosomal protein L1 [Candidatus Aenigmarchaeota archaeon]MDW8149329.1 50S ribosomal protein L1 [Candidatus Aenigmarchaeota archaeon]